MGPPNKLGPLVRSMKSLKERKDQAKLLRSNPYKDPTVAKFVSAMNPVRKEMIQNDLFFHDDSIPRFSLMNPKASAGLFKASGLRLPKSDRGIFEMNANGRLKNVMDYSPKNISWMAFEARRDDTAEFYKTYLDENSIILFVNDISDSVTDVNYNNRVIMPAKDLETISNTLKFVNAEKELLSPLLNDSVLSQRLLHSKKSQSADSSWIKLIFIPSHSTELAPEIIDILQENKSNYELLSVYVNLDQSPLLAQELITISKNFASSSKEMNYQQLLQKAIDAQRGNTPTKKLLTRIGESNLLTISSSKKNISFTKLKHKKTKINKKVSG